MLTEMTEPGLVAFDDIRQGNGVRLFLQPHGSQTTLTITMAKCSGQPADTII